MSKHLPPDHPSVKRAKSSYDNDTGWRIGGVKAAGWGTAGAVGRPYVTDSLDLKGGLSGVKVKVDTAEQKGVVGMTPAGFPGLSTGPSILRKGFRVEEIPRLFPRVRSRGHATRLVDGHRQVRKIHVTFRLLLGL
eukprot:1194762-Prorocentrum_minimum.AAC.2